jgi:chromosome segregation ATPase
MALVVTPILARQAAKRARAQLQASLPANRAEIEAEKDQVRARYALANRRLEVAIARLNEKLANRMVEGSRQREELGMLGRRQVEQTATIAALERRTAELSTTLERTEHRLSAASADLVMREERLAARNAEVQHLKSNIAIRDLLTEEQRLELVARETTIANISDTLLRAQADAMTLAMDRDRLTDELKSAHVAIASRQEHNRTLEAARSVLEAERAERVAELDRRAVEIIGLRAELASLAAHREQIAALQSVLVALRAENAHLRRVSVAEANGHAPVLTIVNGTGPGHSVGADDDATAAMAAAGSGPATAVAPGNGHASAPAHGSGEAVRLNPPLETPATVTRLPSRSPDLKSLGHRLRSLQRAAATRH